MFCEKLKQHLQCYYLRCSPSAYCVKSHTFKFSANITFQNKKGIVFSEDYCPITYAYLKTVLQDDFQFTPELW